VSINRLQTFIGIQSNLFYMTFHGNIEIWSHKTGGHLIQVKLIWNALWSAIKIKIV